MIRCLPSGVNATPSLTPLVERGERIDDSATAEIVQFDRAVGLLPRYQRTLHVSDGRPVALFRRECPLQCCSAGIPDFEAVVLALYK